MTAPLYTVTHRGKDKSQSHQSIIRRSNEFSVPPTGSGFPPPAIQPPLHFGDQSFQFSPAALHINSLLGYFPISSSLKENCPALFLSTALHINSLLGYFSISSSLNRAVLPFFFLLKLKFTCQSNQLVITDGKQGRNYCRIPWWRCKAV